MIDKQTALEKAVRFPQAFRVLPLSDGKPTDRGTWAAYQIDEVCVLWIDTGHTESLKFLQYQLERNEVMHMAKELTVSETKTIQALLTQNFKAIKNVLPQHLTPERAARIAFSTISRSPLLARCTPASLINAVIEGSQLGLEIGGPLEQSALVPFKNTKNNTYEVTLIVEYQGLIALMYNTGLVKNISAHYVFEKDHFKYNYGLNPDLQHTPCDEDDPGKLIYAYAVIHYKDGGHDFEVVNHKIAMEARNRSAAFKFGDSPWKHKDDEKSMWVKTAIRRLAKRVPKSAELRRAMSLEDRLDEGKGPEINPFILDADFEEIPQSQNEKTIPEKTETQPKSKKTKTEEKVMPDAPKGKTPRPDDEKVRKQFMAAIKAFPAEYPKACALFGYDESDPDGLEIDEMKNIMAEIENLVNTG